MSNSRETTGAGASGSGRTLDATMRAPSTNVPDIVVLDFVHDVEEKPKVMMNPKKDLWLSTVDGRHQSQIIPVRVGPHAETFYVHRAVLIKSEYFKKALDGDFREAENQAIDLPEDDPAIFSFVVAFLYEGTYAPIRPVADALVVEPDKGKGKENDEEEIISRSSDPTDSDASGSDNRSVRSRRRREYRRRRAQAAIEERNRKEPGRHRPDCVCATCVVEVHGPPCWNCGVPRTRPPPQPRPPYWYPNGMPHPPPPNPVVIGRNGVPVIRPNDRPRRGSRNRVEEIITEPRMTEEDLRTWVMTYELSVDVYICAEKFLIMDFKSCIQNCIIDEFETAGVQAAQPQILACCKKLHAGVSNNDLLLKKVFARVGFLLARLWKNYPEETQSFFMENPEVGGLIMKETMERRDEDANDDLPAMDRAVSRPPVMVDEIIIRDRHRGFR